MARRSTREWPAGGCAGAIARPGRAAAQGAVRHGGDQYRKATLQLHHREDLRYGFGGESHIAAGGSLSAVLPACVILLVIGLAPGLR